MDLSAEREKVLLNIQNDVLKGGISVPLKWDELNN